MAAAGALMSRAALHCGGSTSATTMQDGGPWLPTTARSAPPLNPASADRTIHPTAVAVPDHAPRRGSMRTRGCPGQDLPGECASAALQYTQGTNGRCIRPSGQPAELHLQLRPVCFGHGLRLGTGMRVRSHGFERTRSQLVPAGQLPYRHRLRSRGLLLPERRHLRPFLRARRLLLPHSKRRVHERQRVQRRRPRPRLLRVAAHAGQVGLLLHGLRGLTDAGSSSPPRASVETGNQGKKP